MDSNHTLLKVEEVAERLQCGRSLAYKLILSGELRSVRIGRCRRVLARDLEAYVQELPGADQAV